MATEKPIDYLNFFGIDSNDHIVLQHYVNRHESQLYTYAQPLGADTLGPPVAEMTFGKDCGGIAFASGGNAVWESCHFHFRYKFVIDEVPYPGGRKPLRSLGTLRAGTGFAVLPPLMP